MSSPSTTSTADAADCDSLELADSTRPRHSDAFVRPKSAQRNSFILATKKAQLLAEHDLNDTAVRTSLLKEPTAYADEGYPCYRRSSSSSAAANDAAAIIINGRFANEHFGMDKQSRRCCCGFIHVKSAALAIGVLDLAYILFRLFDLGLLYTSAGEAHLWSFAIQLAIICAVTFVLLLTFYGIFKIRSKLLLPHLIMQAVIVLCCLGFAVFCLVILIFGSSITLRISNQSLSESRNKPTINFPVDDAVSVTAANPEHFLVSSTLTLLMIFTMIGYFISAFVELWMLTIFVRCYRYLISKEQFKKGGKVRIANSHGFNIERPPIKILEGRLESDC